MVSLKALKQRAHTVKSIKKVTHVMKLVSVSKLKKARDLFEASMAYMRMIMEILDILVKEVEDDDKQTLEELLPLFMGRESKSKYLLIVIGSERGLCGSFNNNLAKEVRESVKPLIKQGKEVKILCIGDKTYRTLYQLPDVSVSLLEKPLKTMEQVKEFVTELSSKFLLGEFDVCEVYYATFISPMVQKAVSRTLIPLHQPLDVESADMPDQTPFEFEPSRGVMLKELAYQFFADVMFSILLEASASEHAARMTAMDNASNNATEIIDMLTSLYNKKRQSSITTELIEIISGAEAIN